jgi:hypothetical protein
MPRAGRVLFWFSFHRRFLLLTLVAFTLPQGRPTGGRFASQAAVPQWRVQSHGLSRAGQMPSSAAGLRPRFLRIDSPSRSMR